MSAIFYDIEQTTPEWDSLRTGLITSSIFNNIVMDSDKKGFNKTLSNIVHERITGEKIKSFSNSIMNAGSENEYIGREIYERNTFSRVLNGGFFKMNEWTGSSPDGRVYEGSNFGLCEYKRREPNILFEFLETKKIPKANFWQVHHQLWVTGADFCDYQPFLHPAYKTECIRIIPDKLIFEQIEEKIIIFIKEAQVLINKFKN